MEVPKKKRRVRKQLFVDQIDQLLLLSEAQLKTWMYHYRREGGGEDRKSWVSLLTITAQTKLSDSAITHARTWLVRNGWLKVVGKRPGIHLGGEALLREYRCTFPSSVGTGKPTLIQSVGTQKPTASAPRSLRRRHVEAAEVRSPLEVTAQAPIPVEVILTTNSFGEGMKEARNESASPTEKPSLPPKPSTIEEPTRPHGLKINPIPAWVCPLDEPATEEELVKLSDEPYELWAKHTHLAFLVHEDMGEGYSDMNAGVRLMREVGYEEMVDVLHGTWECPKTANMGFTDFSFWCDHFYQTQLTVRTFRSTLRAKRAAKI